MKKLVDLLEELRRVTIEPSNKDEEDEDVNEELGGAGQSFTTNAGTLPTVPAGFRYNKKEDDDENKTEITEENKVFYIKYKNKRDTISASDAKTAFNDYAHKLGLSGQQKDYIEISSHPFIHAEDYENDKD